MLVSRGPSDQFPSLPGELADTAGTQTLARVTRDSCSTLWALGPGPESVGTADPPCETYDKGKGAPGHLVDPAVPWAWAQSPQKSGRPRGPSDTIASNLRVLVDPEGPRTQV